VKTRIGRKAVLVNRYIPKHGKSKAYGNWTMIGGDPSPALTKIKKERQWREEKRLARLRKRRPEFEQSVLEEYDEWEKENKPFLKAYGSLASRQDLQFDYDFDELDDLRKDYGSDLSSEKVYDYAVKNKKGDYDDLSQIQKIELNLMRQGPSKRTGFDPIIGYKGSASRKLISPLRYESAKSISRRTAEELQDDVEIYRFGKQRGEDMPALRKRLESQGIHVEEL